MKIGLDAKRAMRNFTGLGNYSRFVIKNLIQFYPDNEYELFCPSINYNEEITFNSNIKVYIKQGFKPFWRSFGITNDIRKENIDIYHGLSNELPFRINKTGVKTVVTIHDLIFLRFPEFYSRIDRRIYDSKAHYACKVADRIIAVSECTKRDIIKFYNIDPNKIDVVYQGCFSIFSNPVSLSERDEVLKKHNLPSRYILSIGSIEERKNILLAVKSLKDLPEDIHLIAIGKKRKYAEQVMQYAMDNKLESRVHMLSGIPLADLPAILQKAEIFVYPSLYEGFGIPIIEALSSGIPVIGAIGSCLEEAGGPNTIYINPYDEKELAVAINRVLDDKDLRKEMIEEGLKYVSRFNDKKCTTDLMHVYEKLLK